jgi:hypothetical protein
MDDLFNQHVFQRYSSEVLWHFVGRKEKDDPSKCFQILLSILQDGKLRLGSEPEPFVYHNQKASVENFIGYPVCCLADIPLKDLPLHSMRYGEFAIGFHRESAIRKNFIPVLYVPQKSWIIDYFLKIRGELEVFLQDASPEISEKFQEFLLLLGSIAKPCNFFGNLEDDSTKDKLQMNNFYYEREWRSIYEWDFSPDDVAMIIAQDAEMAKTLKEKLQSGNIKAKDIVPILTFDMIFKI